jgi:dTDP-4-amino-4,6-dideoxygalactose transaminase
MMTRKVHADIVVPVHINGRYADTSSLKVLGNDIRIVEDASQALGSFDNH